MTTVRSVDRRVQALTHLLLALQAIKADADAEAYRRAVEDAVDEYKAASALEALR